MRSTASLPTRRLLLQRLLPLGSLVAGLLVLLPRLGIEWQWFAQFDVEVVLLRRWLLQVLAFGLVLGLGIPLQLQQLQRSWRLRQAPGPKPLP
ncbi:MAG: hypothetical protein WCP63_14085, partial [Cyanobium sp. ELA712]